MKSALIFISFFFVLFSCNAPPEKQDQPLKQARRIPKILLIGFDGATWKEFTPALEKGLMPNLNALIHRGVTASLKTIKPTLTPVVWTSIASGKMPYQHGITGIILEDPITHEKQTLNATHIKVKRIWDILSDYNKTNCIIRWPVTWPPSSINGIMISDFAFQASRSHRTFPETAAAVVDQCAVDFRLKDIETLTGITEEKYKSLKPEWQWKLFVILREYNLDYIFHEVAKKIIPGEQKDLTAVYYYSQDAIGHSFFKFNDANTSTDNQSDPGFQNIIPTWCWLYDRFLGELLSLIDPETYIVICSDHGMSLALKPQNFLIRSIDDNQSTASESSSGPIVPPGPPYMTNPFAIKLVYTLPSGQHVNAPDGIFVMAGPGIKQNTALENINVCDITPTLLYLMGLPVADDFDGRVKMEVFTETFLKQHTIEKITSFETSTHSSSRKLILPDHSYKKEDALLMNRLKALGYIQ